MMIKNIILASSSIWRKQLLQTLIPDFECVSPDIDESIMPGETAYTLVERLAFEKAKAVAREHSPERQNTLIIASDQVATFNEQILGKPHTTDNAIKQLSQFSGQKVAFLTSLCVYDSTTGACEQAVDQTDVYFRDLSYSEIMTYIEQDQPLKCAGSFKSEGLGVTLFEKIDTCDPQAIIGLPLIKLAKLLRKLDYDLLA